MPVGFKNGTDGGVQIAVDAVRAAAYPHSFLGVTEQGLAAIVATRGNPDCHVILRGGDGGPNYDAAERGTGPGGPARGPACRRRLMIDASHGNSGKDHRRQPVVARDIAEQVAQGETGHRRASCWRASWSTAARTSAGRASRLVYGQSITDACMGWEMTVPVLRELADAVRSRRAAARRAAPYGDGSVAGPPSSRRRRPRVRPAVGPPRRPRPGRRHRGRCRPGPGGARS